MISACSMDDPSVSDLAFAHIKPLEVNPINDSGAISSTLNFNHNGLVDRTPAYSSSNNSLGFINMNSNHVSDYNQSICSMSSLPTGVGVFERAYHAALSRSAAPSVIKSEDPFLQSSIPDCSPGTGETFIFHNFPTTGGNFTAMLNEGESLSGGGVCGLPNIQTMIHHQRESSGVGSFLVPPSPNISTYGILSNQSTFIASPSFMHNFSNVLPMNFEEGIIKHEPSCVGIISEAADAIGFLSHPSDTSTIEKTSLQHNKRKRRNDRHNNGMTEKNSFTRVRIHKNKDVMSGSLDGSSSSRCHLKTKSSSSSSVNKVQTILESNVDNLSVVNGQCKRINTLPEDGKENQEDSEDNYGGIDNSLVNGDVSASQINQYLSVECDNISNDQLEDGDVTESCSAEKLDAVDPNAVYWPEVDLSGSVADPVVDAAADLLNSRMFTDKLDVSVHVEECQCVIVDGAKRFRCLQCPKMYSTKHNLIIHILGHSGIKPHCCNICSKYFKQISHLQTHMLIHGNVKPHICHKCNRTFTQASHVKRHMAVHMNRKAHVCTQCSRTFTSSPELMAHMQHHQLDRDHICDECGSSYESIDRLRRHKSAEHGDTASLSCKICSKSFMYPSQLRDHAAKHDGTRPFICGECGMDFMKEHHLKSHMFTHTGLRPFQCKQCPKAFNQKANLQRHLLVHNGEKRFACEICGRGFTQHQILRAHLVTHQQTKPFQCKVCSKGFSRLHNLNGHMVMHEGGKPFTCACGASFTLKGNLNRHKRDKHGEVVKDTEDDVVRDEPARHSQTVSHQAAKMLYDLTSNNKSLKHEGNMDDRSPAKKKRKSMPRKTALDATEAEIDEVDEVKAAWTLTSEDSLMEDGLSDEEEEEEDGDLLADVQGETRYSEEKLLCTLQPVSYKSLCSNDEEEDAGLPTTDSVVIDTEQRLS